MPELPFTLDQLRILKAIAAQGSFKKAADLIVCNSTCCEFTNTKFRKTT